MQNQLITTNNSTIGKPFPKGVSGNPKGRPKDTLEQKIIKKSVKQLLKEYEENLSEILTQLPAILKKMALNGDIKAIREIHEVVGAHKNKSNNIIVPVQINFDEDKIQYA